MPAPESQAPASPIQQSSQPVLADIDAVKAQAVAAESPAHFEGDTQIDTQTKPEAAPEQPQPEAPAASTASETSAPAGEEPAVSVESAPSTTEEAAPAKPEEAPKTETEEEHAGAKHDADEEGETKRAKPAAE